MALYCRFHQSQKLLFCNFPWILKKTTLSLMLENQLGNVARWLKSRNGHFVTSDPLRFDPQKVLFYLVNWQKCHFEWSYLNAVFSSRASLKGQNGVKCLGHLLPTLRHIHHKIIQQMFEFVAARSLKGICIVIGLQAVASIVGSLI